MDTQKQMMMIVYMRLTESILEVRMVILNLCLSRVFSFFPNVLHVLYSTNNQDLFFMSQNFVHTFFSRAVLFSIQVSIGYHGIL